MSGQHNGDSHLGSESNPAGVINRDRLHGLLGHIRHSQSQILERSLDKSQGVKQNTNNVQDSILCDNSIKIQ